MTTPNEVPGGNPDGSAGGAPDEKSPTVKREAYDALLGEKKKAADELRASKARLAEFETKEAARVEEEQRKRGEFETLAKKAAEEKQKLAEENAKLKAERTDARKWHAFQKALGTTLDSKWSVTVDLDAIEADETGAISAESVAKYVDRYRKEFPEAIGKGSAPGVPNPKPHGSGGSLTHEEWVKLPLKERKARMSEVVK